MEIKGNLKSVLSTELAGYLTDTGIADAYAVALRPAITAYTTGLKIVFQAANANTGISTLAVNGLAVKTIKKNVSTDLSAGDILANQIIQVIYDGTNFQIATTPATTSTKLTVPTVDLTANGPTCNDFNCGYSSSAIGDLVYLDTSSTWQKTDANLSAGYDKILGVALEVKASGNALLVALPGSFIYSTTGFITFTTIGTPLYMSETAGAISLTQPTTTDAAIRVIGWAVHANKLYFFPSPDYITHT